MTLCEANDGERQDYVTIAERLATISASPAEDLRQLWRRIVFGLAINNTDDHLRNHGVFAHFGLSAVEARTIVAEVVQAVRQWETIAVRNFASTQEITVFRSVFDQGSHILASVMKD